MASSTPFSLRYALVRKLCSQIDGWVQFVVRLMVCFALDGGENLICFSSSVSVKPAMNPASPGLMHSSYFGVTFSGEFWCPVLVQIWFGGGFGRGESWGENSPGQRNDQM